MKVNTMAELLDYVKWRGDLTMKERPFNEVDNLVFSELVYFNFDECYDCGKDEGIADNLHGYAEDCTDHTTDQETYDVNGYVDQIITVDADTRSDKEKDTAYSVNNSGELLTIREAYHIYMTLENPSHYGINDPVPLLAACADSARFGDVKIRDFVNIIDAERQIQFAACVFLPEDELPYVAYRGTDSSLVGWREDFNIWFMEETQGQAEAVRYLDQVLSWWDGPLRVGGHSKGGNLAVYAAVFCGNNKAITAAVYDRIVEVFSNDGPGFNQTIIQCPEYQRMLPKVRLFMPDESIIGIIFVDREMQTDIIRSSANDGARQHDPYTWMVERDHFVKAEGRSASSMLLDETLVLWFQELNNEERRSFCNYIFDAMEAAGASSFTEMNEKRWISYNAILKAAASQSPEIKKNFTETLKKLAQAGRMVIWNETQKKFEPIREETQKRIEPIRNETQKRIEPIRDIASRRKVSLMKQVDPETDITKQIPSEEKSTVNPEKLQELILDSTQKNRKTFRKKVSSWNRRIRRKDKGEKTVIKNVVFDIGQVLKGWQADLSPFFDETTARAVEDAIWGTGYWTELDLGILEDEVLFEKMYEYAPDYKEQIAFMLNHLELVSERFDYAIPWIEKLKAAGYHVYYLSNYSRHLRKAVPHTIDFLPLMEGGIFSCDVNLLKPDQKIYQLLCETYDLVPEECLFIDDRQENVDAAIAFGMQAVRFDGYEKSYEGINQMLGVS